MTIQEVENLSAAELKANREKIADLLGAEITSDVLAFRYVQARYDSKVRDEKLAEQGGMITVMQDGMAAAKSQIELLQSNLNDRVAELAQVKKQATEYFEKCQAEHKSVCEAAAKEHADVCAAHDETIAKLKSELEATQAELAKQTARGDRLRGQANRNNMAMNDAANALNKAIAQQRVENADEV